jgi:hypothetical protein
MQTFALTPGRINKFKGQILKHAVPVEVLAKGGRQVKFPKNNSDTYVARRWVPYGATTTNPNQFFANATGDRATTMVNAHLTQEGVTVLPESITPMDVSVVMQQYSCLYGFSDKTYDLYEDDIPQAMQEQIGERVALVNEMIVYGVVKASTNQYYGGTGTSRSTVSGGAITLASSGSMGVNSGCGITFANGSILTAQAGSALNISGVITAKGATQYKLDARAVTRTFSANRYSVLAFQAAHIGLSSAIIQINTTYTDEYVSFDLPLPNGCTLTSVSVGIKAALHGASWPPAGPFQIRVQKKNITTGALTTIVLQNDSVAVQATYEAYHLLTATCSEVIDRTTYTYFAEVNVENGANATTLGEVHDCKATFTVDTVDEGN